MLDQIDEPIDLLCNIAGYILPQAFMDVEEKQIDLHMGVNVKGVMLGTLLVGKRMVAVSNGHIINVASMAGVTPVTGLCMYSATKFASRAFSICVAKELRGQNVHVSVVCPDAIDTPMLRMQKKFKTAAMTFSGGGNVLTLDYVGNVMRDLMISRKTEVAIPVEYVRGKLAYLGNISHSARITLWLEAYFVGVGKVAMENSEYLSKDELDNQDLVHNQSVDSTKKNK